MLPLFDLLIDRFLNNFSYYDDMSKHFVIYNQTLRLNELPRNE